MEISQERGKVVLSCALSSDVSEQMKPLVVVVLPTSRTWSHQETASPEFGAGALLLADKTGYLFATASHGVSHGLSASVVAWRRSRSPSRLGGAFRGFELSRDALDAKRGGGHVIAQSTRQLLLAAERKQVRRIG